MLQHLYPSDVLPPHEVRDRAKYDALVESLTRDGWQGKLGRLAG